MLFIYDALAEELGIGRQAVYAGLRSGTIPSIRMGKRFILPKSAIQEWLKNARGSEQ
jgi:excisionase family DNA binding protein